MNFSEFKDRVKKFPFFGSDLAEILSVSPQAMRNQLARWKKQGLLVELKRGMYALGERDRSTALSKEVAAANIYQPSYISLESALSAYKMIPEKVQAVTSVTTKKTKTFNNQGGTFIYRKIKTPLYFGYISKKDEGGYPYFIAEPEKALLDHLYLDLGSIHPGDRDYLAGSLRLQNVGVLNKKKLASYAKRFNIKKIDRILEQIT